MDATSTASPTRPVRALTRVLAWSAAVSALAAVFALYLQPALLVSLSEQLWACFN